MHFLYIFFTIFFDAARSLARSWTRIRRNQRNGLIHMRLKTWRNITSAVGTSTSAAPPSVRYRYFDIQVFRPDVQQRAALPCCHATAAVNHWIVLVHVLDVGWSITGQQIINAAWRLLRFPITGASRLIAYTYMAWYDVSIYSGLKHAVSATS